MNAADQYPSLDAVAAEADLALRELDLVRELLRRHVMDWGGCINPRADPCDCSDAVARSYLINLGIHPGSWRDEL